MPYNQPIVYNRELVNVQYYLFVTSIVLTKAVLKLNFFHFNADRNRKYVFSETPGTDVERIDMSVNSTDPKFKIPKNWKDDNKILIQRQNNLMKYLEEMDDPEEYGLSVEQYQQCMILFSKVDGATGAHVLCNIGNNCYMNMDRKYHLFEGETEQISKLGMWVYRKNEIIILTL